MDKRNFVNGEDIPMGLGMAMAQNVNAMDYFSHLDAAGKQQIINQSHNVHSKKEMQEFVNNMAKFHETAITDSPEDPYNGIYL
ncbi:MAG: hypothetical protein ACI4I7_06025 [Oscillospiraceae bacterium]